MRSQSFPFAYLLVTHGSRDPRPHWATAQLAQRVVQRLHSRLPQVLPLALASTATRVATYGGQRNQQLASKPALVGTAVLELGSSPLPEQIQQFTETVRTAGYRRIRIVPLFLLPGVHVMEDIPEAVAEAQSCLGTAISLELQPYLGSHPQLAQLVADSVKANRDRTWMLLAHGSRRPGGNRPIEQLAQQLGMHPAYWAVEPSARSQLERLVAQGQQRISLLPYFLFEGSLTDAIAQMVKQFVADYPQVTVNLAQPLSHSLQLADLITDLALHN